MPIGRYKIFGLKLLCLHDVAGLKDKAYSGWVHDKQEGLEPKRVYLLKKPNLYVDINLNLVGIQHEGVCSYCPLTISAVSTPKD